MTADRKHPAAFRTGDRRIRDIPEGRRVDHEPGRSEASEGLPSRALPGRRRIPQSTQEKGAEEHGNADEQQTTGPWRRHPRCPAPSPRSPAAGRGNHPILRSVGRLMAGQRLLHRAPRDTERTSDRPDRHPLSQCSRWISAQSSTSAPSTIRGGSTFTRVVSTDGRNTSQDH